MLATEDGRNSWVKVFAASDSTGTDWLLTAHRSMIQTLAASYIEVKSLKVVFVSFRKISIIVFIVDGCRGRCNIGQIVPGALETPTWVKDGHGHCGR